MSKKILSIAIILLVFSAIGTVFAQVCLGPTAARVRDRGTSVQITNTMDEDINVEIRFDTYRWNSYTAKDEKTGSDDFMVRVGAKDTVSRNLPARAKYTGYEVYSCR